MAKRFNTKSLMTQDEDDPSAEDVKSVGDPIRPQQHPCASSYSSGSRRVNEVDSRSLAPRIRSRKKCKYVKNKPKENRMLYSAGDSYDVSSSASVASMAETQRGDDIQSIEEGGTDGNNKRASQEEDMNALLTADDDDDDLSVAYSYYSEEESENTQNKRNKAIDLSLIYGDLPSKDKWLLRVSIIAAIIKGAIPTLSFSIMGVFVNVLIEKEIDPDSTSYSFGAMTLSADQCLLFMLLLSVTSFFCEFVASYGFENASLTISNQRKTRYLAAILHQDASFFDLNDITKYSSNLYIFGKQVKDGSGLRISQCIGALSCVTCSFLMAFILDWRLTLGLMALLPFVVVAATVSFKMFARHSKASQESYQDAGSLTEESFAGIRTVQAFDIGEFLANQYQSFLDPCYEHDKRAIIYKACANMSIVLFIGCMHALGWYLAGLFLMDDYADRCLFTVDSSCFSPAKALIVFVNILNGGNMFQEIVPNIGSLMLTTQACRELDQIIHRTPKKTGHYQKADASSDKDPSSTPVKKATETRRSVKKATESRRSSMRHRIACRDVSSTHDNLVESPLGEEKKKLGDIEFKNVEFFYPTRPDMTILKNFSVKFETGKAYALVGPSGCGKSTIVEMILRFYDPAKGRITFGGEDFRNMDVSDVRNRVALVQQEPRLFATSIYENVAMGICDREKLTPAQEYIKVTRCLQMAQAGSLIESLEDHVFYNVGWGGQLLSGGQRQRVAIARALARDPELLILDEATSALDNTCERKVQEAIDQIINNGICTVLMIAHRLSTVRNCDKIFVLTRGDEGYSGIVESGDHNTLMNIENGTYKRLYAAQSLSVSVNATLPIKNIDEEDEEEEEEDNRTLKNESLSIVDTASSFARSMSAKLFGPYSRSTTQSNASFNSRLINVKDFEESSNSNSPRRITVEALLKVDPEFSHHLERIDEGKILATNDRVKKPKKKTARERKLEKEARKKREKEAVEVKGRIRQVYHDSWAYSDKNKVLWVIGVCCSCFCAIFFPILPLMYAPAMRGMIESLPMDNCYTTDEWNYWCVSDCAINCDAVFYEEFCLDSTSHDPSQLIVSPDSRMPDPSDYTNFDQDAFDAWSLEQWCSKSSDDIIRNGIKWGGVYFTVALVGTLTFFGRDYCLNNLSEDSIYRKRSEGYSRVIGHDIGFFEETNSGSLSEIISTDLSSIRGALDNVWINIQIAGISFFAITVGLATNWELAIIASLQVIFGIPAGFMITKNINKSISTALLTGEGNEEAQTAGTVGFVVNEIVSNIKLIQAYNHEMTSMNYFYNASDPALQTARRQVSQNSAFVAASSCMVYLSATLTFFWADSMTTAQIKDPSTISQFDNFLLLAPDLDVISFITIYTVFVFWGMMVGRFSGLSTDTGRTRASLNKYYRLLSYDRQVDIDDPHGRELKNETPPTIDVDDLCFRYPSKPKVPVYNRLNFTINSGQMVALVGPSGSGKSTMIQLLERFYPLYPSDNVSGSISFDGVDVTDINLRSMRNSISLVEQMPMLFNSLTIGENIAVGLGGKATQDEIVIAAQMANADSFIQTLPDKYDTKVGLGGSLLSGGQKQRVALARAMIRKPSLLLLDEATSALDAESEAVVQAAIQKIGTSNSRPTIVIIAHRLASIKHCEKIIVIKNDGQGSYVTEEGTHDSLMKIKGVYSTMVNASM
eukprot:GHVH01010079.1.p1 GENE.GHVH01010079.1~~GHVH01010079.1.p1  ORF type:complete len:1677 (+),score=238.52 GHVH01010079.1:36-5066(+)